MALLRRLRMQGHAKVSMSHSTCIVWVLFTLYCISTFAVRTPLVSDAPRRSSAHQCPLQTSRATGTQCITARTHTCTGRPLLVHVHATRPAADIGRGAGTLPAGGGGRKRTVHSRTVALDALDEEDDLVAKVVRRNAAVLSAKHYRTTVRPSSSNNKKYLPPEKEGVLFRRPHTDRQLYPENPDHPMNVRRRELKQQQDQQRRQQQQDDEGGRHPASAVPNASTPAADAPVVHVASSRRLLALVLDEANVPAQGVILLDIYNSMGGDFWNDNTGWIDGDPELPCSWYGITCHGGSNLVQYLDLSNNNLDGTIPTSIGGLKWVESLDMSLNDFLVGPLPSELGDMECLQFLFLGFTSLGGTTLPKTLGNLTMLQTMDIADTAVGGEIPSTLGASMQSLTRLWLYGNRLTGPIPATIGDIPHLGDIDLSLNYFSGPIPPELGNLAELFSLWLIDADVEPPLPPELANAVLLEDISLNNNIYLEGGTIPPEWGALDRVHTFWLFSSGIGGTIPSSLGNMAAMRDMALYSNNLGGPIPDSFGQLTNMVRLWLHQNSLNGTIPDALSTASSLSDLNLNSNDLSGILSPLLGNLPLINLRLDQNLLTGPLPAELCSIPTLQTFVVSQNQLNGSVPWELFLHGSSLQVIDLHANELSRVGEGPLIQSQLDDTPGLCVYPYRQDSPLQVNLKQNLLDQPVDEVMGCFATLGLLLRLDLSDNRLYGVLENGFNRLDEVFALYFTTAAGFQRLIALDLSRNLIEGSLPWSISQLSFLTTLNLADNNFTGAAPDEWETAISLQTVDLEGNVQLAAQFDESGNLELPSYLSFSTTVQAYYSNIDLECWEVRLRQEEDTGFFVNIEYFRYTHCFCLEGLFWENNACVKCPDNVVCDTKVGSGALASPLNTVVNQTGLADGGQVYHVVRRGFYPLQLTTGALAKNLTSADVHMIQCYDEDLCNPSGSQIYQCDEGHDITSVLCHKCISGGETTGPHAGSPKYYRIGRNKCVVCRDWFDWFMPLFNSLAVIAAFVFLFVHDPWKPRATQQIIIMWVQTMSVVLTRDLTSETESSGVSVNTSPTPGQAPRLTAEFVTNNALAARIEHSAFVENLRSVVENVAQIRPWGVACLKDDWDERHSWWMTLCVPPAFCAITFCFYLLVCAGRKAYYRYKGIPMPNKTVEGYAPTQEQAGAAAVGPPVAGGTASPATGASAKDNNDATEAAKEPVLSDYWSKTIYVFLFVLNIAYFRVVVTIMEMWNCENLAPDMWVVSSIPWLSCHSTDYKWMLAGSIVGAVVYMIGIPFLFLRGLWQLKKRNLFFDPKMEQRYGFLFAVYHADTYYWEIGVVLMRKVALAASVTLLPRDSAYTAVLILVTLFIASLLQMHFLPYRRWFDNILESALLGSAFMSFVLVVIAGDKDNDNGLSGRNAVIMTLFIVNMTTAAVCIFLFVWDSEYGENMRETCCPVCGPRWAPSVAGRSAMKEVDPDANGKGGGAAGGDHVKLTAKQLKDLQKRAMQKDFAEHSNRGSKVLERRRSSAGSVDGGGHGHDAAATAAGASSSGAGAGTMVMPPGWKPQHHRASEFRATPQSEMASPFGRRQQDLLRNERVRDLQNKFRTPMVDAVIREGDEEDQKGDGGVEGVTSDVVLFV